MDAKFKNSQEDLHQLDIYDLSKINLAKTFWKELKA